MNQFGHHFRLSIWGESHGTEVGILLDGVPEGIRLSEEDFEADLSRRRSGAEGTTPRHEKDIPQLRSGVYRGYTTGAPLAIEFLNEDTRSEDYSALEQHFRPSHADFTATQRFRGYNDPRGGGHFSARLTVGLVAAGVVAKKMLPSEVRFTTCLKEVGGSTDETQFQDIIRSAMRQGDSVGGVVECRVEGIPAGWGEPFFDSVESRMAHLLFSIPAVKGVEFGSGFEGARLMGSQNNDPIINAEGKTSTNHSGGINGGLTNGNEIVVRVAIKPTPSISRQQMTYNQAHDSVEELHIKGRHDACVALRGQVVVEAAVAITLADLRR